MFKFLKDKLKGALGKFSKEVEKDATIEKKEILVEKKPEVKEKPIIIEKKIIEEKKEDKKGFFQKIFGKKDTEEIIEEKEKKIEQLEKSDISTFKEEIKKNTPIPENRDIKQEKKQEIKTERAVQDVPKEKIITVNKIVDVPEYRPHTHEHVHEHTEKHENHHSNEIYEHVHKEKNKDIIVEIKEEKKGLFTKITETFTKFHLSEEKFEELFWELEVVLLENNVAVEVIEKIKKDMKKELMTEKISRSGVEEIIMRTLKTSIIELFNVDRINLIERIKEKNISGKPYIITIIGVNGSGKTTSIAKLTHLFQKSGLHVVLAASDTFRAAAIQQLEEHANNLNVKLVKHDYNSDPAAVAFDAIKYAEAKNANVVIIDTAGRLHSNTNLMRELEKIVRVCNPDIKIFVGESITGNDCIEQAKEFDKAVGIDAIILAKADVDEKGGAAISVSYVIQKPILYLGTGQTYDDLKEFDSKLIIESLEL